MRDKLSKFLFPVIMKDNKDGTGEFEIKFRFGIFSIIIWKIFCLLTGEK